MKNNKTPGIDNLTSDVMILAREELVTQITKTKTNKKNNRS